MGKKLTLNGYWLYVHHIHDQNMPADFPSSIAIADEKWQVSRKSILHKIWPCFSKCRRMRKKYGRQPPKMPWKRQSSKPSRGLTDVLLMCMDQAWEPRYLTKHSIWNILLPMRFWKVFRNICSSEIANKNVLPRHHLQRNKPQKSGCM